jgi:dTDP-4-dehydrorhamnose reductase
LPRQTLTTSTTTGAANRFPDKCDADPAGARALNVSAAGTLARLCAARALVLVYISTDYVFSGRPGEAPYEPHAAPQPTNLYGATKLAGEAAVREAYEGAGAGGRAVVLRMPVLYGAAETPSESAVNVLLETVWRAQGGAPVEMEHWALRYPTNTEDVGRVCKGARVPSFLLLWFYGADRPAVL